MHKVDLELRGKLSGILGLLDERARRLVAANEAHELGYGGVRAVQRACGMSRVTITKGLREIAEGIPLPEGRIRRAGAGRKPITERDAGLLPALDRLIAPGTRGDPESPLKWICLSTRTLARELAQAHHPICRVNHFCRLSGLDPYHMTKQSCFTPIAKRKRAGAIRIPSACL
ncbi:MAG: hypothetical protein R6X19_11710 [Kiritimatiellia bacterium]